MATIKIEARPTHSHKNLYLNIKVSMEIPNKMWNNHLFPKDFFPYKSKAKKI